MCGELAGVQCWPGLLCGNGASHVHSPAYSQAPRLQVAWTLPSKYGRQAAVQLVPWVSSQEKSVAFGRVSGAAEQSVGCGCCRQGQMGRHEHTDRSSVQKTHQ